METEDLLIETLEATVGAGKVHAFFLDLTEYGPANPYPDEAVVWRLSSSSTGSTIDGYTSRLWTWEVSCYRRSFSGARELASSVEDELRRFGFRTEYGGDAVVEDGPYYGRVVVATRRGY